jgi:uncharacterized protein YqjF (DUF2071 family)
MSTFLTAEWRKLIMAQYEVDPTTLKPWLPSGVELDLYTDEAQGQHCYVSLVGFLFDRVRLKGFPIPFHTRFEEINLRFYVVRNEPDGTRRRGVVFVSEIVPHAAISFIAKTFYQEPYTTHRTRHTIASAPNALIVRYEWQHTDAWHHIAVEASPLAQPIAPNSIEDFITEHYWGYTKRRNHTTSQYAVQHPRWQTYPIRSHSIQADFAALYGPAFAHLDAAQPTNILLAEGSAISVATNSPIR